MTFIEALEESFRRIGLSEDDIKKRIQFANIQLPISKTILNAEVKSGSEEEFIGHLVKLAPRLAVQALCGFNDPLMQKSRESN